MKYFQQMKEKAIELKEKDEILILAIESSCDETSAAVVKNGREIMSNIIASQIETHKIYGGVVPEIASRKHVEVINEVIRCALDEANVEMERLDAIAVTYGPGLVGALLVGVSVAKGWLGLSLLCWLHHIEGEQANFLQYKELEPPFVCLIVSIGHTQIVNVIDYGHYQHGQTWMMLPASLDKVARYLGSYPGNCY